mgnify:CR=1 FL=1
MPTGTFDLGVDPHLASGALVEPLDELDHFGEGGDLEPGRPHGEAVREIGTPVAAAALVH